MLELRYGALVLSHLLTGDPVYELGDDATVYGVEFQVGAQSDVDDVLIIGKGSDGTERLASVAVRRSPKMVPSDERSVDLIVSYLSILTDRWRDVQSGRWRIALASTPTNPVRELGELTAIAHSLPDEMTFREAVSRRGRTNNKVRKRLELLDEVVETAALQAGAEIPTSELTWRFLSSLTVRELRLEPPDESDLTAATTRLRAATVTATPDEARRLLAAINDLVDRYVPTAAKVTEVMLRRDLAGSADLKRSSRYSKAWQKLDALSDRLRERTGRHLADPSQRSLKLRRERARSSLVEALNRVGAFSEDEAPFLVISGEPDVGKSALTLDAVEEACEAGAAIITLSLRDLPRTVVDVENVLGAPLVEILAGTDVRPIRIMVVDGAEAALEGRQELLDYISLSSLKAGLGVVAVTRTDGERMVREILGRASSAASSEGVNPNEYMVRGLTGAEIEQAVNTFPVLERLGHDERSSWLLGRPGLVDLLLRADSTLAYPDRSLSEADVFAAVWSDLVRLRESTAAEGVSPDEREHALLALAQRVLKVGEGPKGPLVRALPSLRSDGLILSAGPTAAWNPIDGFASDLIRDFALARLMRVEGYAPLLAADAPRWMVRAARLSCQAAISAAGENSEQARQDEQATFDKIAEQQGSRWSEIPLEAMLTLGDALTRAWPALCATDHKGLQVLVRIALQRYTRLGVGEPAVLTPLIELIHTHWTGLRESATYTFQKKLCELLLAWLRGLIEADVGPDRLRARVRDTLLEGFDDCRAHISHINPARCVVNSNGDTRCSRIAEHSGYHEC